MLRCQECEQPELWGHFYLVYNGKSYCLNCFRSSFPRQTQIVVGHLSEYSVAPTNLYESKDFTSLSCS